MEQAAWQYLEPEKRMKYLLDTGHLSDCSFVVFDEFGSKITIKCHKFVLMTSSPVFERMFDGNFEENSKPENIVLDDVQGSDFKYFIEYLYCPQENILNKCSLEKIQILIYLSKKFLITKLTRECINILKNRLNSGAFDGNETIDLYEYAHQIEDEDLIRSIKMKFANSRPNFLNTAAVFELSSDVFLKFFSDIKDTGPLMRFNVMERYCKVQGLTSSDDSIPKETKAKQIKVKDVGSFSKKLDQIEDKLTIENGEDKIKDENNVDELTDAKNSIGKRENSLPTEEDNTNKHRQMQKDYIKKLLQTIDFNEMTAQEFCEGPAKSNLLIAEEKLKILSNICTQQCSVFGTRK